MVQFCLFLFRLFFLCLLRKAVKNGHAKSHICNNFSTVHTATRLPMLPESVRNAKCTATMRPRGESEWKNVVLMKTLHYINVVYGYAAADAVYSLSVYGSRMVCLCNSRKLWPYSLVQLQYNTPQRRVLLALLACALFFFFYALLSLSHFYRFVCGGRARFHSFVYLCRCCCRRRRRVSLTCVSLGASLLFYNRRWFAQMRANFSRFTICSLAVDCRICTCVCLRVYGSVWLKFVFFCVLFSTDLVPLNVLVFTYFVLGFVFF